MLVILLSAGNMTERKLILSENALVISVTVAEITTSVIASDANTICVLALL